MKIYPPREDIVSYLRSSLIGPSAGEDEEIQGTPFLRYMAGILFPQGTQTSSVEDSVTASVEEEQRTEPAEPGEEDGGEQPMELTTETLPSAVGISFKVKDGARIQCHCSAGLYRQALKAGHEDNERSKKADSSRGAKQWRRSTLSAKKELTKSHKEEPVFDGLGLLTSHWRPQGDGTSIVTVALLNKQVAERATVSPEKAFFQVRLACSVAAGAIEPYPEVGSAHAPGSEEEEVEFLYRKAKPFARGHGAAAAWKLDESGKCGEVSVDFLPTTDVPSATFELGSSGHDARSLDLEFLDEAPKGDVVAAFRSLARAYAAWIQERRDEALKEREHKDVALRFVERADEWAGRMEKGIALLENDSRCWDAFRLANRAMGMQMTFYGDRRKEPFERKESKLPPAAPLAGRRWRPFQIAFLLGSIESLANPNSNHRGDVDVIWFPTGGGKTEAYLLLTAFELVRRRIIHGEADTATAVLSRYTYRFLTAQQFQRTAALIAALEILRVSNSAVLGERRFSLGLWVGGNVTPNKFTKAHEKYTDMMSSSQPRNAFILEACPCCNTEIVPSRVRPANREEWDPEDFGIESTVSSFRFRCTNPSCDFHQHGLPLNVVDEALYQEPPSMLIGTIDKFAQLPWDDRARKFFGGAGDDSVPASLIIQDELHLISGPLGSLAAPYEAAIDTVIKLRGGNAKRIASTATIRNAAEQVRGLYGRKGNVFPSPCGKWDDAFFFRTDMEGFGRKYVGAMGQGYVKPVVAMAWTAAAMLQSVNEVQLDAQALDSYWTVLAYHNSKRELGRTMTATQDEVQTRIGVIASSPSRARVLREPLELSAGMTKSMSEATQELERPSTRQSPSVDFVPCTNIISVGVDITRLGIMLVNGQPKLTSEYIQATSRVGRGKVPGLVVSLYSPAKPRDRSHYEDFRAYHEAIYRHVEPTSVTPYAIPARERTLHAALVSVVRHALRWRQNPEAGVVEFDDPIAARAISELLSIMVASDPSEQLGITALMEQRIAEWRDLAEAGSDLYYENRYAGPQFRALLADFGKAPGSSPWRTMNSMRNVDSEVIVEVQ